MQPIKNRQRENTKCRRGFEISGTNTSYFTGMLEGSGMQRATTESIKSYINEIHISLLVGMAQMLGEYKNRFYVYEIC